MSGKDKGNSNSDWGWRDLFNLTKLIYKITKLVI